MDEFQAKYYLTALRIYLIKFQFCFTLLCNTKLNLLSFHHSRTFLQGQEHTQLCWRIFPHPDAVISSTEDFVWSVLENSGPEQAQGYVMYCRISREPIHWEQSRAQGSCYFCVCRLQSKNCKAHSRTRLRTECYFRTATCYTARSFPFCPFLLK